MIVEKVVVVTDPVCALKVISMPDPDGPWRSVLEVASGAAQKVIVTTDDTEVAERVYFVV